MKTYEYAEQEGHHIRDDAHDMECDNPNLYEEIEELGNPYQERRYFDQQELYKGFEACRKAVLDLLEA